MTDKTPQTENEAAGGHSRAGEAGANLTDVLAGDLVTLTMTNLTRAQAKAIVDQTWGSVMWCCGKAYPARDIECSIEQQPANI